MEKIGVSGTEKGWRNRTERQVTHILFNGQRLIWSGEKEIEIEILIFLVETLYIM